MAVVGIHAHGGGVDEHLNVGVVPVQRRVVHGTRARYHHDFPRSQPTARRAGGQRGAAAAQDGALPPGDLHPRPLRQGDETADVGVVPHQRAVPHHQGVHAPHLPGGVGQRVAVGVGHLLVGDGHVQPPEIPGGHQRDEFILRTLPQGVCVIAQPGVNLRRIAVPQLRADQAVFHMQTSRSDRWGNREKATGKREKEQPDPVGAALRRPPGRTYHVGIWRAAIGRPAGRAAAAVFNS